MALSGLAVLPVANRGKVTNIAHCGSDHGRILLGGHCAGATSPVGLFAGQDTDNVKLKDLPGTLGDSATAASEAFLTSSPKTRYVR
jgi:hypothetical protein